MTKKIIDIMTDLETLDNNKNPVITQISAVSFDIVSGERFTEFNKLVNPKSGIDAGLTINGGTVSWWLSQDKDVIKNVFIKSIEDGLDLKEVLLSFSEYIKKVREFHKADEIRLWGNGCLSDNVWLESAYDAVGLPYPWSYNEHTDVRTLVDLGRRKFGIDPKETIEFKGDKHNAIDDCHYQIDYCCAIYNFKGE